MKKNLQIFIKIILIILGLTYSNSSLAIHEKETFTWEDFVLKNGVLIYKANKDYMILIKVSGLVAHLDRAQDS